MNFPTGDQVLDTEYLLALDDRELGISCSSNPDFYQLCSDDYFWKVRLHTRGFRNLIKFKDLGLYPTYQAIYFELIRTGLTKTGYVEPAYVVIFDEQPYICSNIDEAYQIFITWLSEFSRIDISLFPPIERSNELINIVQNLQGLVVLEIYILFGEVHLGNTDHLLLGVNNKPNYNVGKPMGNVKWIITPNLYQMPNLNPTNTYIFYICYGTDYDFFSTQTFIALMNINDNTINRIIDYNVTEKLSESAFWVRKVNDNYNQMITNRKEQRIFSVPLRSNPIIRSYELPAIIIYEIKGHFYMALLQREYYRNYRNLEIIQRMGINNAPVLIVDYRSLNAIIDQILPTLEWQPIEDLANYPVDPNFLQTLHQ
jgi:hypothetical protein